MSITVGDIQTMAGTGLHIAGTWRQSANGAQFAVDDPATGETLAQVADATEQDCLDAVTAASDALDGWAHTPPRQRSEVLRRCFDLMNEHRDLIATAIVHENGKSWADAQAEAGYAAEFFRWFAEETVRIGGEYRLAPGGDKRILVEQRPVGVALLITPWNFPAAMATRKIAPALAAGCSVVLKPAPQTPLTAAIVVELIHRAGVPAGVVNLVSPSDAGPAVSAMLERVEKVSFTGSTAVGKILLRQCADRVINASMELGGNAPFIVLPDADIPAAVEGAMQAKMRNGGAACTAANRFIVHESVYAQFSELFAQRMGELTMGPGTTHSNNVGALVSDDERDKVADLVAGARSRGAGALTGGERPTGDGAFYPPTVLTDVAADDPITQNEIFGPVAPVIKYGDGTDPVQIANNTRSGLIAYVYGSTDAAMQMAHRLQAGMVAVNRGVLSDPAAPFGGVKESGLGREGGHEGIGEFLEPIYIAVDSW